MSRRAVLTALPWSLVASASGPRARGRSRSAEGVAAHGIGHGRRIKRSCRTGDHAVPVVVRSQRTRVQLQVARAKAEAKVALRFASASRLGAERSYTVAL